VFVNVIPLINVGLRVPNVIELGTVVVVVTVPELVDVVVVVLLDEFSTALVAVTVPELLIIPLALTVKVAAVVVPKFVTPISSMLTFLALPPAVLVVDIDIGPKLLLPLSTPRATVDPLVVILTPPYKLAPVEAVVIGDELPIELNVFNVVVPPT